MERKTPSQRRAKVKRASTGQAGGFAAASERPRRIRYGKLPQPPETLEVPYGLERPEFAGMSCGQLTEIVLGSQDAFLDEAAALPGFSEATALAPLQEEMVRLGSIDSPDREVTRLLAAPLVALYDSGADEAVTRVRTWLADNEDVVSNLISEAREQGPGTMNLLMAQPEVLMILERIEHDALRLKEAWPADIPLVWLTKLAEGYGHPYDE